MSVAQQVHIDIDGCSIPMEIHLERRSNQRIAIGRDRVILRLPRRISKKNLSKAADWAEAWVVEQFSKHPQLLNRFQYIEYLDGNQIHVRGKIFHLRLETATSTNSSTARLNKDRLIIGLHPDLQGQERHETTEYLVDRLMIRAYEPWLRDRVLALNQEHFGFKVGGVKLRAMKSRWGSCKHSTGQIHIAIRLLLAPTDVLDAVIIHELAHLLVPNHSAHFWNTVYSAIPKAEYKKHDSWLKQHAETLRFRPTMPVDHEMNQSGTLTEEDPVRSTLLDPSDHRHEDEASELKKAALASLPTHPAPSPSVKSTRPRQLNLFHDL